MAFIFGKGKKKNDTAQPEVAAAPYEASVDTQGTQTTIAENRKVRQDIERRFNELKDPMFRSKIRRVAEKNQDMIDKHAASHKYADSDSENYSDFAEMEKDMYIVMGGYREAPTEENGIPGANLDYYTKAVTVLEAKYKSTSSANAVETGADKLEVFVEGFLANLRNALEMGYALKANAAIDLTKYVFCVGHRYVDYNDEAEREKGVQNRTKFLENVGKSLIDAIDNLYERAQEYKNREDLYSKTLDKLVNKREKFDSTCPRDVKQLIDSLGFKGAMSQLPPGDERRKYLDMMLDLQSTLVVVLENSLMLESIMRDIVGLKHGIETMGFEVRQAFDSTGKEFDFNKHMKVLTEIHERNLKEMRDANKKAVARANAEEELMGRLNSIADNVEIGNAVQGAAIAIQDYSYLQKQNELLVQDQERRRAEYQMEKKKMELEREKRRIQEREQYLNELRELEEEFQEIEEKDNEISEAEIEIESETVTETAEDNREIITEEI